MIEASDKKSGPGCAITLMVLSTIALVLYYGMGFWIMFAAVLYPTWLVVLLFGEFGPDEWIGFAMIFGWLLPWIVAVSLFLTMRLQPIRNRSPNIRMIVYMSVIYLDSLILGVAISAADEWFGLFS